MRSNHRVWSLTLVLTFFLAPAQAQTCRENIPASVPDSRFKTNGNGTVTDRATGLIWKQCTEGLSGTGCQIGNLETFTWQAALKQAADAVFAGSSLWRLPNKKELASLVELRCYQPAINSRFFPNTPSSFFWSSSPGGEYSDLPGTDIYDFAWGVDFDDGDVWDGYKGNANYVRLVLDGQ